MRSEVDMVLLDNEAGAGLVLSPEAEAKAAQDKDERASDRDAILHGTLSLSCWHCTPQIPWAVVRTGSMPVTLTDFLGAALFIVAVSCCYTNVCIPESCPIANGPRTLSLECCPASFGHSLPLVSLASLAL